MSISLPSIATAVGTILPTPVVYLHVALFLGGGRTVGDETFRLVSFQGQENISQPFEFKLELHGNDSTGQGARLAFDDVVGRPVAVGIHYPSLDGHDRQPTRDEANQWFHDAMAGRDESGRLAFFNGIAASFSMERPGVYRLGLKPALWKLTLTNAYRVLPHMSVRDAIEALLKPHGIDYSVDALVGSDNLAVTRIQDWLQAGESDYDLLVRLMSKAHIYYFFKTTAKSHTVVFANRPAYPAALPGGRPLRYCSTGAEDLGLVQADTIVDYRFEQSLTSTAVKTVFTREEAAWETDPVATFHSFRAQTQVDAGELPFNQYMIYQYGCSDAEVDHFANNTQDALTGSSREFSGTSFCPFLRCGYQFGTTQFPRAGQWPTEISPALEGMSWVVRQVEHQASIDGTYQNKFKSTDAASLVTPFSFQETQQGTLLAKVVAHDSGVAPADWRYLRKENFDPETATLTDTDGCPPTLLAQGVCVVFSSDPEGSAPVWVKLSPSMQTAPEIGALVLVSRAQDQSELPEIQNIVEASGTKVVKPSGWTSNTNVGSSYSTAYGDGISIRFGLKSPADPAGATGIVSAQYASGKYREVSYAQGATYSYATSDSGAAGLLSSSDSFGSTYSNHHGTVSSSTTVFADTDNTSTVTGTSSSTTTIGTSDSTSTTATSKSTSIVGTHVETSITGASSRVSMVGASSEVSLSEATSSVSLKRLSSQIEITGAGLLVQLAAAMAVMQITGVTLKIPEMEIVL
ncbi:MAG: type IV secretion protein Rhs [Ramlibacter sp.]|nr:type IV secretion protein Rhs [Ramlibacter sp.]